MALSNDLISEFVKATMDKNEPAKESTAYGKIVVKDGKEYVQLDGSDLLTPISTTTVVKDEDRVMVTIKNHTAIVTGDLTNPSASNKDVTDIGNKISEFEIVIADKVTTEQLEAEVANINKLVTDEFEATNGKIETLEGKVAKIDKIEADIIEVSGKVTAHEGEFDTLRADIADFKDVTAGRVDAVEGKFNNLSSDYAEFEQTVTTRLQAAEADIKDLDTEKLDAETAKITYATIDFANINEAAVEKLFSDSGIIKDLIMSDGKVTGELVGVTIKGDIIEGNTVKADKLVILGEDGLYYKLNVDALGETTASSDDKYQNGLDGSVIIAESITAEKIAVDDLVAFGATIGGFKINNHAIYSGVKNSIKNTTTGIYLGDDGQVNIGDQNNFLKYYIDENGKYRLEIQADSLRFGSSNTTIEEYIQNNVEIDPPAAIKTVEGTYLNINDGKQIIDFNIYGKSEQSPRYPAQLIDVPYNESNKTWRGITYTVKPDNSITAKGTCVDEAAYMTLNGGYATSKYPIPEYLIPGETYTISGGAYGVGVALYLYRTNGTGTAFVSYTDPTTFVMPAGYAYYGIFLQVGLGVTVDGTVRPMLNKGSTALPFTDGYLKSKNIVPTDFSDWESGQYALEDGNKVTTATRIRVKRLIKVCPNTVYYAKTDSYNFVLREYDSSRAYCKSTGGLASSDGCTFTTGPNTHYIGISLYDGTDYATFQSKWNEIKPFICLNSEPNKNYTTHKRSIKHTRNIFDYMDGLLPSNGGVTSVLNPDHSITSSGVPVGNWNTLIESRDISDWLDDGCVYTVSQKEPNNYVYVQVSAIPINDSTLSIQYYAGRFGPTNFTVDKSKYTYLIKVQCDSTANWGTSSRTITNFYQLEKGSVATEFEKYGVSPSPDHVAEIKSLGYENIFFGGDTYSSNGITFTKNQNGTYNISGTATNADANIYNYVPLADCRLMHGKDFIFHINQTLPEGVLILVETYNGSNWINYLQPSGKYLSGDKTYIKEAASIPGTTTQVRYAIRVRSGYTVNIKNLAVMLEEGIVAHSYIPVSKYGYEIVHLGKNMFDYVNNIRVETNGVTSVVNSDGSITVAGIPEVDYQRVAGIINIDNILENGQQYTISHSVETHGKVYLEVRAKNKSTGTYTYHSIVYGSKSKTFTVDKSTYTYVIYAVTTTISKWGTENLTVTCKYQLEKGSMATEFEPYRCNKIVFALDEPLRSTIDGIRDVAGIQNGVLRVERKLGGVKFNGNEPWGFAGIGNTDQRFDLKLSNVGITNIASGKRYSSHFIVEGTNANPWGYYYMSPEWLVINNNDNAIKTLADFKSWVAANKPEFVYNLATPIIEEIQPLDIPIIEGKHNRYHVEASLTADLYCKYGTIYAGLDGQSIYSVTDEFYVSTSKTALTGGSWSEIMPTWSVGQYLWTRSKIVYSNPTATEYTEPMCDSSWEAVNNINIGARNWIKNSAFLNDINYWTNTSYFTLDNNRTYNKHPSAKIVSSGYTSNMWRGPASRFLPNDNSLTIKKGETWSMSCMVYIEDLSTIDSGLALEIKGYDSTGASRQIAGKYPVLPGDVKVGEWFKLTRTFTATEEFNKCYIIAYIVKNGTMWVTDFKLEKGDRCTDWSPAPEDADQSLEDSSSEIYSYILKQDAQVLIDAGVIVQEATKKLVTKKDFDNYTEITAKTEMKTTAEGVFINLNETHNSGRFSDLDDDIKKINDKLNKNFSFTQDGMIIGSNDSAVRLIVDNENGIIFERKDGYRLGYWDGNDFYAGNIVIRVDERAQFGNYAYIPKSDGSLMFTRVK